MAPRKKKQPKKTRVEFDFEHHSGTFDLYFLKPQVPPMSYEAELLTAEEKAEYYEDLAQNNGVENFDKIAKDCMKKAGVLSKKVDSLEKNEALPLLEKIVGLVSLANDYKNPTPPDVLASQKIDDDATPSFLLTPELKNSLAELGLPAFKPTEDSDKVTNKDTDDKDSELVAELRRKAKFWKNINTWSVAEQFAYYFCGPVKPTDWTEAVFVRAQKHRSAIMPLSWEARHPMMRLLELSKMGNEDAIRVVVEELERYVRLLNLYAKISPQVFKKVASKLQSWPVVYSPHPKLNHIPQTITKQLGLGSEIDYVFDSATEWNPNELVCKIVMHLYEHIKKMRQYPESNKLSPFFDEAIKLPDIKRPGSVKAWWGVAERIIHQSFPKPEESEILRKLTKIENRGKANSKIREIIKNRFFTMFSPDFR